MPSTSEKMRRFMGAELARKREGKETETGMSEGQLADFARKPVKNQAGPAEYSLKDTGKDLALALGLAGIGAGAGVAGARDMNRVAMPLVKGQVDKAIRKTPLGAAPATTPTGQVVSAIQSAPGIPQDAAMGLGALGGALAGGGAAVVSSAKRRDKPVMNQASAKESPKIPSLGSIKMKNKLPYESADNGEPAMPEGHDGWLAHFHWEMKNNPHFAKFVCSMQPPQEAPATFQEVVDTICYQLGL